MKCSKCNFDCNIDDLKCSNCGNLLKKEQHIISNDNMVNNNITNNSNNVLVDTVNNSVSVDTVNNNVSVDTVNNNVSVDTVNNNVSVDTVNNDVSVDTVNNNVSVDTVNNSVSVDTVNNNVKKSIIKYILKCYIPFIIVLILYILLQKATKIFCSKMSNDMGLICALDILFVELAFIIFNYVIVLPFIVRNTSKLLKQFDDKPVANNKYNDYILMIILGLSTVFLISKISLFAFLLIPIIILLYFKNDDMNVRKCKKYYYFLIIFMLIGSFFTDIVFYKLILLFNVLTIPLITIFFYLINKSVINIKVSKKIPFILSFIILILSIVLISFKGLTNFKEDVEFENINVSFSEIDNIEEIIYVDDENIYFIASVFNGYSSDKYLGSYNIKNKEGKLLFSNPITFTSGDNKVFLSKNKSIYMIDVKSEKVTKIINENYSEKYSNNYYMHYQDNFLYFMSGNNAYKYNLENSKIDKFSINNKNGDRFFEESILLVENDMVFTKNCYIKVSDTSGKYTVCQHNFDGNRLEVYLASDVLAPSYSSLYEAPYYISDKLFYYYNTDNQKFVINDIVNEKYKEYIVSGFDANSKNSYEFIGLKDNKLYMLVDSEYDNRIYYFDLSNESLADGIVEFNDSFASFFDSRNINSVYLDGENIYVTSNYNLYIYNLNTYDIQTLDLGDGVKIYGVTDKYIYCMSYENIYAISKDVLKSEVIYSEKKQQD